MSNALVTLALSTLFGGGALAAIFISDPCGDPCSTATVSTTEVWSGGTDTGSSTLEPGTCSENMCSIDYNEPCFNRSDEPERHFRPVEATASPGKDRRLSCISDTVWSGGGSDTGTCTPEMGRRRPSGTCSETECSIEVAYKEDDNCKITDDWPCEPEKPVIVPRGANSVAIMDDELQDRRSGCIPVHRPPPPTPSVLLACYRDDRGDIWNPFHEGRCYDLSGDIVAPDVVGPCFDRWGNSIGWQTSSDDQCLI